MKIQRFNENINNDTLTYLREIDSNLDSLWKEKKKMEKELETLVLDDMICYLKDNQIFFPNEIGISQNQTYQVPQVYLRQTGHGRCGLDYVVKIDNLDRIYENDPKEFLRLYNNNKEFEYVFIKKDKYRTLIDAQKYNL